MEVSGGSAASTVGVLLLSSALTDRAVHEYRTCVARVLRVAAR